MIRIKIERFKARSPKTQVREFHRSADVVYTSSEAPKEEPMVPMRQRVRRCSMKRLHALLLGLLALLTTTGAGPFEETRRQVRFYRTNLRLTQNLIDQHPTLPPGSCVVLQLPGWLDSLKPDPALLYRRTRLRLAKGLKKLNGETPLTRLLKQIPNACQDETLAQKRLKMLLQSQRGAFETVLATTILTLEQYDFTQKASGFRTLYREYFPNRDMEKEFRRRYNSP